LHHAKCNPNDDLNDLDGLAVQCVGETPGIEWYWMIWMVWERANVVVKPQVLDGIG
jgi:hypothetical protein